MAVVADTGERYWLDELNDEQRAAATHRGGPPAHPRRRRDGQDDDALCACRVARRRGCARRADPAADVHPACGAGDAPRARRRGRWPALGAVLGGTFHSVAHRLVRRHAAALGLPAGFGVLDAGDAADLLDLRPRRSTATARPRRRFPRKGTLPTSTRARSTRSGRCARCGRELPVVRGARRGDLGRCSRRTRRASARSA